MKVKIYFWDFKNCFVDNSLLHIWNQGPEDLEQPVGGFQDGG
jgi:hypothetical protein